MAATLVFSDDYEAYTPGTNVPAGYTLREGDARYWIIGDFAYGINSRAQGASNWVTGETQITRDSSDTADGILRGKFAFRCGNNANVQPTFSVRYASTGNTLQARFSHSTQHIELYQIVGGSATASNTSVAYAFQPSTPYRAVLEFQGTTFNVYLCNDTTGEVLATASLTVSLTASGKVGPRSVLVAGAAQYNFFDNLFLYNNIVVPAAPGNVTATDLGTGFTRLAWDAVNDAALYELHIGDTAGFTPGAGTLAMKVGAGTTSWDFAWGTVESKYLKVVAVNSQGSAASAAAHATGPTLPVASAITAHFTQQAVVPFNQRLAGFDTATDDFSSETLASYNQYGVGSAAISGGVLAVTGGGFFNAGADLDFAQTWVSLDIAGRGANADAVYAGLVKDASHIVAACWDPKHSLIRILAWNGGGQSWTINSLYLPLGGGQKLGFSLIGNIASVWIDNGAGAGWEYIGSSDVGATIDFSVAANLTGWKRGFGVNGTGTWNLDNFTYGSYGGVAVRDPAVVVNETGAPRIVGNEVYLIQTVEGPSGANYPGLFSLDLATFTLTQRAVLWSLRNSTKSHPDAGAMLVAATDGSFEYLTSSWATYGSDLHVYHAHVAAGGGLLAGRHAVAVTQLALPLPAPNIGCYDPYAIFIDGYWLLAYTATEDLGFTKMHTVVAATADWSTWNLVASGAQAQREGSKIGVVGGAPSVFSATHAEYTQYDFRLNRLAGLDCPMPANKVYPPHPMVLEAGGAKWLITFDGTAPYGGTAFGSLVVYSDGAYTPPNTPPNPPTYVSPDAGATISGTQRITIASGGDVDVGDTLTHELRYRQDAGAWSAWIDITTNLYYDLPGLSVSALDTEIRSYDGADYSTSASRSFGVYGQTSKTLQAVWNVDAYVGKALQMVWDVGGPVAATVQAVWAIGGKVGNAVQALWNINAWASKAVQLRWALSGFVSKAVQLIWGPTPPARVTQVVTEVLTHPDPPGGRITTVDAEVSFIGSPPADVTQLVLEVLIDASSCPPPPPPPPEPWAGCPPVTPQAFSCPAPTPQFIKCGPKFSGFTPCDKPPTTPPCVEWAVVTQCVVEVLVRAEDVSG